MSIGLTAVGLLNMIEHVEHITALDRWFVVGPVAIFLTTIFLIASTLEVKYENNREIYQQSRRAALFAAGLLVLVGFIELSIIATLLVTWVLLTLPVFAGFRTWVKRRYEQALREGETN